MSPPLTPRALHSDLLSDYPDKKSILMYVMCLFQQLPANNIVIEDSERSMDVVSTTSHDQQVEGKVCERRSSIRARNSLQSSSVVSAVESTQYITYQANMERILQWILKLENDIDQQEQIVANELKAIKELFQNHEVNDGLQADVPVAKTELSSLVGLHDRSHQESESNR